MMEFQKKIDLLNHRIRELKENRQAPIDNKLLAKIQELTKENKTLKVLSDESQKKVKVLQSTVQDFEESEKEKGSAEAKKHRHDLHMANQKIESVQEENKELQSKIQSLKKEMRLLSSFRI